MQGNWDAEILSLPNCGIELDEEDVMVWNGPRARMGICEGEDDIISRSDRTLSQHTLHHSIQAEQ